MNPLSGIQNDLNALTQSGVNVNLSFENNDYVKMGAAIFVGLFLALVLANVVTK